MLTTAGISLGLSFTRYEANLATAGLAYLGFGVLAFSFFRIRPRWVGGLLGAVAAIPLVLGMLLAAIAGLPIAFAVADTVPEYVDRPTAGVACYARSFGNATTSIGGWDVVIKEQVPVLSFLEREVMTERFINPTFSASQACEMVFHAG